MSSNDVWQRLAAPLAKSAISWRQDGKAIARDGKHFARFVCYIEANTVRERLDSVFPGEWDLTMEPLPTREVVGKGGVVESDADTAYAVKAALTVAGRTRQDVGHGRDWKQASTDAFKRAAVRFGIAHELYAYEQNWVRVDGDSKYAKPLEDPQAAYDRRHKHKPAEAPAAAPADAQARRAALLAELGEGEGGGEGDADASAPAGASHADVVSGLSGEPDCPKCGGPVWDNRVTKRNPKAPDYKCRDRSCAGVIWPPREGHAEGKAAARPVRGNGMDAAMYDAMQEAEGQSDDASLPF